MRFCAFLTIAPVAAAGAQAMASPVGPAPRWLLVYSGGPKRPHRTIDDMVHSIAMVDTAGKVTGWLFNGAIYLEVNSPNGHDFIPMTTGALTSGLDWQEYLDSLLAPAGPVAVLDSAVGTVTAQAGALGAPFKVTIMIPYPSPQPDTVILDGSRLALGTLAGRFDGVTAYLVSVEKRFGALKLTNIQLAGFYWINEGITPTDTGLVRMVSGKIHSEGKAFYWIPAFGATGASSWRVLGFDEAWQQPNYFFHAEIPTTRLDTAVAFARKNGMGLELELDKRLFGSWVYRDRVTPYLSILAASPDLRSRTITVYDGGGAILELSRTHDPWLRALYNRLCAVLRSSALTTLN